MLSHRECIRRARMELCYWLQLACPSGVQKVEYVSTALSPFCDVWSGLSLVHSSLELQAYPAASYLFYSIDPIHERTGVQGSGFNFAIAHWSTEHGAWVVGEAPVLPHYGDTLVHRLLPVLRCITDAISIVGDGDIEEQCLRPVSVCWPDRRPPWNANWILGF